MPSSEVRTKANQVRAELQPPFSSVASCPIFNLVFKEVLSTMARCATAESLQTWPLTEKRLIPVLKIQGFECHFGSNGNQCRSQADFSSHFQQEMLLNEQSVCQTSLQYEYKSTFVRAFLAQLQQLCLKTLFSFCAKSRPHPKMFSKFHLQIPNSLKLIYSTIHPINSHGCIAMYHINTLIWIYLVISTSTPSQFNFSLVFSIV